MLFVYPGLRFYVTLKKYSKEIEMVPVDEERRALHSSYKRREYFFLKLWAVYSQRYYCSLSFYGFTVTALLTKHAAICRILVITATNRNGQKRNGHKPKRPQTGKATNRNGHKPERPQTETATARNGHKPKRPQTEKATDRNDHKPKRPKIEIDTTISDSAGYKFVCSIEVSN